ncbi:MAG: flagellar basal body-associated protein FliL [Oscillospiraceae bacterium]
MVSNESGLDGFIEENQYVIRDVILFKLRDLTEEDIRSETIQDQLRSSIPSALNDALGTESIQSVYFSDFVMQ